MEQEFLSLSDVVHVIALKKSTIYKMIANHQFPSPVRVGVRRSLWRRTAVLAWVEQQGGGNG